MNRAYKEVEELLRTPTEDGLITIKRSLLLSLLNEYDELEKENEELVSGRYSEY